MIDEQYFEIFKKMVERIIFEDDKFQIKAELEKLIFKSENWESLKQSITQLYDNKIQVKDFNNQEIRSRSQMIIEIQNKIRQYQDKIFNEILDSIRFLLENIIKKAVDNIDQEDTKEFLLNLGNELMKIKDKLKK